MMSLSSQNYKWVIVLLFVGIIVVPAQMPSPTFKFVALAVLGGGCLFFEVLSLRSLKNTYPSFRNDARQTISLIVLTVLLLVVNLVI